MDDEKVDEVSLLSCLLALIFLISASERLRYHEPVGSTTYLIVKFLYHDTKQNQSKLQPEE